MLSCFGWVSKSVFPSQLHLAVVVQLLSHVRLFATPWTAACQAPLFYTISQSLLKLMSIELMMLTISSSATSFSFQRSIFLSIRVFSKESALHIRWQEYWNFSVSPSDEYSGLTSFRIDWFFSPCCPKDSQESSPHHNLKASVLWHSVFFMVHLSHLYMTTGKAIALTIWILPAGQCLWFLICWLDLSLLSFQGASIFNFMATVNICSDFGAQ